MKLKDLVKKVVYRHRADSESYSKWLTKQGLEIGRGTTFIDPRTTVIDVTRPWMIKIGKSCCITAGVTILSHDYGWSVIKAKYGEVIGSVGFTSIGDNVYIGMNSTILGGGECGVKCNYWSK